MLKEDSGTLQKGENSAMSDITNLCGKELIEELSLVFGPSGCEDRLRQKILPRVEKTADKAVVDRMGNLIAVMRFGAGESKKPVKIMLSAHMDEVGFMVNEIRSDGTLTFTTVGGIDTSVLSGRKVFIDNGERLIDGVICSKAIHHKSAEEREQPVKLNKLYIDVGAKNGEEGEKLVRVGDFGTFNSEFYTFGKGGRTLKCKALDDRMGCAAMLEIMDALRANPPKENVEAYFCFTTREEIGYSGAGCAAELVKPDLAVILETTAIGDLPDTELHRRVADVGKGGVVSYVDRATVYPKSTVEAAIALAKENNIAVQPKRYVSGGNDAGNVHGRLCGIKTLAVSIPTRYLHSASCVASLDDYEAVRDLARAIIENAQRINSANAD